MSKTSNNQKLVVLKNLVRRFKEETEAEKESL